MAAGAVETVGARLSLTGVSRTVSGLEEVSAAYQALRDEIEKTAAASDAAGGVMPMAVGKSAAASRDANVVSRDQALANDAVTASTVKRVAATKKLTEEHGKLRQSIEAVGSGPLGKIGKWGSLGLLGVGLESIKQYTDFQKTMVQTASQAGLAASRLPALSQGVLGISKNTGMAFQDVANQMYRIKSATSGLKETNKQLISLTQSAANLALLGNVAPGSPTEQVARIFGSMRTANLKGTGKTPWKIAAWANATVGAGDIRMSDLMGALGRGVLQSSQLTGTSAVDLGSWIDLMTRYGAQGSTSGTLISHAVNMLATGSEQSKHVEEMLGLNPTQLADTLRKKGKGGGLSGAMALLQKSFSGGFHPVGYYPAFSGNAAGSASALAQLQAWAILTPQQTADWQSGKLAPNSTEMKDIQESLLSKMWGGARQEIPLLTAFVNQGNLGAIQKQISSQMTQGAYNRDLSLARNAPANQMRIAERQLQAYSIELGKAITPDAIKFLHGLVDVAKYLSEHPLAKDLAVYGTAGAVGVGGLAWMMSKAFKVGDALARFGSIFTGSSGSSSLETKLISGASGAGPLNGAAAALMSAAEALQVAAAKLDLTRPGGGVPVPGRDPLSKVPKGVVPVKRPKRSLTDILRGKTVDPEFQNLQRLTSEKGISYADRIAKSEAETKRLVAAGKMTSGEARKFTELLKTGLPEEAAQSLEGLTRFGFVSRAAGEAGGAAGAIAGTYSLASFALSHQGAWGAPTKVPVKIGNEWLEGTPAQLSLGQRVLGAVDPFYHPSAHYDNTIHLSKADAAWARKHPLQYLHEYQTKTGIFQASLTSPNAHHSRANPASMRSPLVLGGTNPAGLRSPFGNPLMHLLGGMSAHAMYGSFGADGRFVGQAANHTQGAHNLITATAASAKSELAKVDSSKTLSAAAKKFLDTLVVEQAVAKIHQAAVQQEKDASKLQGDAAKDAKTAAKNLNTAVAALAAAADKLGSTPITISGQAILNAAAQQSQTKRART